VISQQPPPELFTQRPVQSMPMRRGPSYAVRRLITVSILLLVISGGLYWAFGNRSPSVPGEIPTIKAEGSYKQRPQQPGGIEIPHQDVQVYQALDAHTAPETVVEHLLPPPETPQPRPATAASSQSSTQKSVTPASQAEVLALAAPKVETPKMVPDVTSEPAPTPAVVAQPPVPPPSAKTPSVQATTVATAPAAKKAPKTLKDVLEKESSSGKADSIIQLVSVSDEDAARDAMEKLHAKYATILDTVALRVVRADLGPKGIYYRVQSQPIPATRAKEICADFKNLKAGCLIVRP